MILAWAEGPVSSCVLSVYHDRSVADAGLVFARASVSRITLRDIRELHYYFISGECV